MFDEALDYQAIGRYDYRHNDDRVHMHHVNNLSQDIYLFWSHKSTALKNKLSFHITNDSEDLEQK